MHGAERGDIPAMGEAGELDGFGADGFGGTGLDAVEESDGGVGGAHPDRAAVLHGRPDMGLAEL